MTETALDLARFLEGVREAWSVHMPAQVDQHADLHDVIGADSLEVLELVMIIESMAYAQPHRDAAVPAIATIADAFDYYTRLLGQQ